MKKLFENLTELNEGLSKYAIEDVMDKLQSCMDDLRRGGAGYAGYNDVVEAIDKIRDAWHSCNNAVDVIMGNLEEGKINEGAFYIVFNDKITGELRFVDGPFDSEEDADYYAGRLPATSPTFVAYLSNDERDLFESQKINEGNFYECRDCGTAWVPGKIGDPDRGELYGTEENPKVSGAYCPKCGSSRVRVEY